LAGIDANGQREFLRALAGLLKGRGNVQIGGNSVSIGAPKDARAAGISYLPGDRHREGIFADLSVRENFSLRSMQQDSISGIVNQSSELRRSREAIRRFAIKTPSSETQISSLSGGNQQKVVMASVLASDPTVLLVDEPTQGVDVGARAEIYKVLRETAAKGVAIIVLSSDAHEVAGLSDRVAIFSRGHVVETLEDEKVSEDNITSVILKSTSRRVGSGRKVGALWKWASGNSAPLVMVAMAILLLGAIAAYVNPFYVSQRSLAGMMTLIATLAFVAYGQQLLMLVGGIDLSVGPLMALGQVVASYFLFKESDMGSQLMGWAMIMSVSAMVGIVNWILVDPLKLHPMIATLATFMAVQAIALLLRPIPGGLIDGDVLTALGTRWGFIPVTFVAALILAIVLEILLYRKSLGLSLRGFGSRAEAARVTGVHLRKMRFIAYVGCSLLTGLAAITLIQQVGIGDARAGLNYTLGSIAAAVIGGASLFGGRGSFIGAMLGAVFITQINAVTSFMSLDQAWQSYLLGSLIIASVAVYSLSRQKVVAV
jgi:ribose transport system ATP-binding protein